MSGNFIQRGLPALINKWARTEMALANGVDLVIELPVYYAVSSAEFFSYGSIKILDSLGIVSSVCFGSENGDIEPLSAVANVLVDQPESFRKKLTTYLSEGLSFPSARSLALQSHFKESKSNLADHIESIINQPNNILGIEYLKALNKLNSRIVPYTIGRHKAGYNSIAKHDNIASATAIRDMLKESNIKSIQQVVPKSAFEILDREIQQGRAPIFLNAFDTLAISEIRKSSPEDIRAITDVSEGMENRIKKAGQISGTLEELLGHIKTKRYTLTRLQRILIHLLLGLTQQSMQSFNIDGGPQYARILGFSSKGREILSKLDNSVLPLVTSPSDFLRTCTQSQKEMLEADILASDIYSLAYPDPSQRAGGQDYYQKIITP
jgi:predicted nucleotidyltransferase